MTSTTSGALTPAVYWRRRLFVVGLLVALVLIVVNVVSGGSDPGAGVRATTAGAEQGATDAPDDPDATVVGPKKGKKGKKANKSEDAGPTVVLPTAPVLAEPTGTCEASDIVVTPSVKRAVAGRSAVFVLKLRTGETPACTWQISSETLQVRVSVGNDEVWTTRYCTAALAVLPVVVRSAVTTTYELRWNTRRSEDGCPGLTEYAQPGDYRVTAGALGGEPDFVIFDLAAPTAPEPEPAPEPEKKDKQQKDKKQKASSNA